MVGKVKQEDQGGRTHDTWRKLAALPDAFAVPEEEERRRRERERDEPDSRRCPPDTHLSDRVSHA